MARTKGSINKRSEVVRRMLADKLDLEPALELGMMWKKADNDEIRLRALKELLPYCYPKLSAVQVTGADEGPLKAMVEIAFTEPKESKDG
jgi:hypothetical protein